jgi:hypothetical protein
MYFSFKPASLSSLFFLGLAFEVSSMFETWTELSCARYA